MKNALKTFEKTIVISLLGLMSLAVLVSTVELAIIVFQQIMKPPVFLLNITEMLEIFGFFLMVLIGLELLDTIKSYLEEDRVHAEVVILVALVAVSRKVIILNISEVSSDIIYGISTLIVALGIGYFFVKRALCIYRSNLKPPTEESADNYNNG
jgi:uncharacterized membrane protein (DUF373 family)